MSTSLLSIVIMKPQILLNKVMYNLCLLHITKPRNLVELSSILVCLLHLIPHKVYKTISLF